MGFRWIVVGVALTGCTGDGAGKGKFGVAACELAEERATCPECSSGLSRCSFDGVSVETPACGSCQTEHALLQELCDQGSEATRDEIDAGLTCEQGECVAWVDACGGCVDACDWAWDIPATQCDVACSYYTTPGEPPPPPCLPAGDACVFADAG